MKLKVTVDGKVYEVDVEVAPEPAPVLPTFLVQSAAASVSSSAAAGGDSASLEPVDEAKVCRSPVSGIVVKANARSGETIQPGDLLFVLEAMKMETEVTAGVGGKIAEVRVKVGDSVKSGEVVLTWA